MKVVDSIVLKKWYSGEYSFCDNGKLRGEFKQFLSNLPDDSGDALELGGDTLNLTALMRKGYSLSGGT
ncbi:hypothetical protein [Pseudomonas agarici]|uniref:hypothetical protein n=1 Tax=Pseudomonas agarici TaxID=46677 RepID=UPI000A443EED|nr:hypothetical protein [Pseudomonas agarici]